MPGEAVLFADRHDAGGWQRPGALSGAGVVVAIQRGGRPVSADIARALGAPLDVIMVRKIGAPWQPEYAIGAVAERPRSRSQWPPLLASQRSRAVGDFRAWAEDAGRRTSSLRHSTPIDRVVADPSVVADHRGAVRSAGRAPRRGLSALFVSGGTRPASVAGPRSKPGYRDCRIRSRALRRAGPTDWPS